MKAPTVIENLMPDVQGDADRRELAIDRVGIRGLRYPLHFSDGLETRRPTVATFDVYVGLPADRKGTHMSRLVEMIDETQDELSLARLPAWMAALAKRLDADTAYAELRFPWFMRKRAPVSSVESLMDYDVRIQARHESGATRIALTVVVPVTSLCPSSKAIASYGAHSQRSHFTISVRMAKPMSLADLIDIAEQEASSPLYGILKRGDEKFVTEQAYDHPKFVEDLVRGVAARLVDDSRIGGFRVEAENFESIHNHSAYARIDRGF